MKHRSKIKEKEPPLEREIKWLLAITLLAFLIVGTLPYLQFHFIDPLIQYAEAADFYIKPDFRVQLQHSGTGTTCPVITSPTSATSVTGTTLAFQYHDQASATGCYINSYIIEDSMFPDEWALLVDNVTGSGPAGGMRVVINLDEGDTDYPSNCEMWIPDNQETPTDLDLVDPRLNATGAYHAFRTAFSGDRWGTDSTSSWSKCATAQPQGSESKPVDETKYWNRVNQTFWSWGSFGGISFARELTNDREVFFDDIFLKFSVDAPVNHTNNWWQMQEHPMYPGTYPVITDGFFGIDGTTFTMDTGTTAIQRGQVGIFKQFNKTELTGQITNVTSVDNLVAYYTFEEPSGVLINQAGDAGSPISFGTAADGTVEAGITRGDGGIIGSSYLFPGSTTGQITLGSSTSQFNFLHNTTAKWTMNFWINSTTTSGGTAVIQNNVGTTSNRGMNIGHTGGALSGSSSLLITRGVTFDAVAGVATFGSPLTNGVWNMVTYTFDYNGFVDTGVNAKVYVNGVLSSDEGLLGDPASDGNAPVALQMGGYGNIFPFAGNLDEFSIWNDELTASEILNLYNSQSISGSTLPDIRVRGGIMSLGTSADMHVRVEIKDGNFQAGQTEGHNAKNSVNFERVATEGHDGTAYFERNEFPTYKSWDADPSFKPLHSLGVFDIEDSSIGTADDFEISFIPNWENSTEDIITVFVAVQDNSTTGSLIANITSIEIENIIRYNFTDVQDFIFYEPNCDVGMATTDGTASPGVTDNDANCGLDYSNGLIKITNITTTGSFTEPPPEPEPPTNLAASPFSPERMDLTWDHPLTNVTNFLIQRDDGAGFNTIALITDPTLLSFKDVNQQNLTLAETNKFANGTSLEPDTSYSYKVCAVNGNVTETTCDTTSATTTDDENVWYIREHDSGSGAEATFTTTGGSGNWLSMSSNDITSRGHQPNYLWKSFNLTETSIRDSDIEFYWDHDLDTGVAPDNVHLKICENKWTSYNDTIFDFGSDALCDEVTSWAVIGPSGATTAFSPSFSRFSIDWESITEDFITVYLSYEDDSATTIYDFDIQNFTWTNATSWAFTGLALNFTASDDFKHAGQVAECQNFTGTDPLSSSADDCDSGVFFATATPQTEFKQTQGENDWQFRELKAGGSSESFGSFDNSTAFRMIASQAPVNNDPTEETKLHLFKEFPATEVIGKNITIGWNGVVNVESASNQGLVQVFNGTLDRWSGTNFENDVALTINNELIDTLTTLTETIAFDTYESEQVAIVPSTTNVTVVIWFDDDNIAASGIIAVNNVTINDIMYNFTSSLLLEEVSDTNGGDRGLVTPFVVPGPPHDISEVNATATENDVFLEWAYDPVLGNETTTETWKYREQDSYGGSFEVCWFFSSSPTIGMEFDEQQGCGQEAGGAWLFKSIPTTEITGSDIVIEIGPVKDITSTLYVFDGFYNENLTTAEWPETFVSSLPTLKGGGILGSLGLPSGAGLTTHTLNASSINYTGSTTGNITVAVTVFSSNIFGAENVQIQNINVTNIGFYNFSASTENDYGTPESFADFRDSGEFLVPTISETTASEPPTDVQIERKLVPGIYSTIVPSLIAVNVTAFNNEEYLDESVSANTTYQYKLTPYNGVTAGNPTESNEVLTNDVPTAPYNLTAAMGLVIPDLEDVFLNWNNPLDNGTGNPGINANITHYWVERKAGLGAFNFLANTTNATSSYEDESVISGANYTWRVRAVNPIGFSPYSNSFSLITTPLMVPNAPTNLTATAVSGYQINVQWLAGIGGDPPTSYVLQQRHVGFTGFVTIATIPAPTLFYNVTGLLPGNTYDYRVRADNGAGSSAYSNIDQAITFNVPSAPQTLNAVTFNNTRIDLTWLAPVSVGSGIENYTIEKETPVGGGFFFEANTTNLFYSSTGLIQNTVYNYRVKAANDIGYGVFSNQDNDKTHGVPDAPINLSYSTNGISEITVDWDSPVYTGGVPLTAYTIEQAQGIGGTFVNAIPNHAVIPSDNTFIGLLQSTNYIYKIAAKNQYGTGSYSANLTAGTFSGPSEPENFLAVFNFTYPYSVNLSWSVPLDDGGEPIQGYIIQRKNLQNVYVQIANVTNSTFAFTDSSLLQLATHVYRIAAYGSVGDFTADQPVTTVVTPHFQTFTIDNFDVLGDVLRQNYTVVIDDCFPACILTQADIERNGIVESNYVVGSSIPLNTPISFTTYFIIPNTGTQFINTTALVTNLGSNNSNETGVVTTQLQFVVPTLFFSHDRVNSYEDINFTLVRHPIPWDAECTHVIASTFLTQSIGISGTQPTISLQNIGSYNDLINANPSQNSYIACYDPVNTQILAFTSFGSGNGTLALTTFTNQLGDFMGVPVPFIFVLFFAAIWTGRSAPTGIIMLAVVIGFLGVLGYFDPLSGNPTQTQSLEAFWGLIVILTLLGVFIGKRFF